jgi:hypothetical protein
MMSDKKGSRYLADRGVKARGQLIDQNKGGDLADVSAAAPILDYCQVYPCRVPVRAHKFASLALHCFFLRKNLSLCAGAVNED